MAHEQTIPAQTIHWDHLKFWGRRIGPGHPSNRWGILYAGFRSSDDADNFPNAQPIDGMSASFNACGQLVDHFFWDNAMGPDGQFHQTETRVGVFLRWALSHNPTAYELSLCEGLLEARKMLAGAVLFDGFFVATELPSERTPEGQGLIAAPEGWGGEE